MNYKEELVDRYIYLYQNSKYLVGYFLEEYKGYLRIAIPEDIKLLIEEFLLGDREYNQTDLYNYIENLKNDKNELNKIKKNFKKIKDYNASKSCRSIDLNITTILNILCYDIERQKSIKIKSKEEKENCKFVSNKLSVLDEYYRLFRYQNDGTIIYGGRCLMFPEDKDLITSDNVWVNNDERISFRGLKTSQFIIAIQNFERYDNYSIFSEDEKQQVYLLFHDEFPWNLKVGCIQQENGISYSIIWNDGIKEERKFMHKPCLNLFNICEEDIVYYAGEFYQLCPICGNIVIISKGLLSEGMQERIKNKKTSINDLIRKSLSINVNNEENKYLVYKKATKD